MTRMSRGGHDDVREFGDFSLDVNNFLDTDRFMRTQAVTGGEVEFKSEDLERIIREVQARLPDVDDDHFDVLVMKDSFYRKLRDQVEVENPTDFNPLTTFLGIRIESYATQGECLARAYELKKAGVLVAIVEND